MSPSKRPHDASSILGPTKANVDGLRWYQIRDENHALLLKVEAFEKASQALPPKLDQRFTECVNSIEALAARVALIEEENRQMKEERRICGDELASLKEQLRALWEQDSPRKSLHRLVQDGPTEVSSEDQSSNQHVEKTNPSTSRETPQAPTATVSTISRNSVHESITKTLVPTKEVVQPIPAISTASPANPTSQSTKKAARKVADRKPSKAAAPKSKVPGTRGGRKTPPKPTAPSKTSPTTFRNLEQGPGGILTYYNTACKIHSGLGGLDSQGEIEFVDAFLAGMSSAVERDDLSSELEQCHPSRTKKDGNIQLMCRWEDVEAAMVFAGFMPPKENEEGWSNKKRKTLGDVLSD